jgi:hypothetical protein
MCADEDAPAPLHRCGSPPSPSTHIQRDELLYTSDSASETSSVVRSAQPSAAPWHGGRHGAGHDEGYGGADGWHADDDTARPAPRW